jgi:hypothetical protein
MRPLAMFERWLPEGDAAGDAGDYQNVRRGQARTIGIEAERPATSVLLYDADGRALGEPPRRMGFRP